MELRVIVTTAADRCLSFLLDNTDKISNDGSTFLLTDFRANAKEWKIIANAKDKSHWKALTPPPNHPHVGKKYVYFIFLMNDGVVEGHLILLPTDTVLNYSILLGRCYGMDNEIIKQFESYSGHPFYKGP